MQTCQNGTSAKSTLDEIAKELHMSTDNLRRILRIERNLTDSMKELLISSRIYHNNLIHNQYSQPTLWGWRFMVDEF
ncbi:hypothetical protein D7V86_24020 [bacterium D16-51]|nr:hypothetical protein D7V96_24105 [bacterium D16-59]RKI54174.1 hypothetical protein D7V86_24020 [bacterium D16-51]